MTIAAALALTACPSADDVAREPVRWTATYSADWEHVANCIARASTRDYRVTPLLNQRERTAEIIVAMAEGEAVQFIIAVRGLPGERSEVTLKRRKMAMDIDGTEAQQRANADRCGRRV